MKLLRFLIIGYLLTFLSQAVYAAGFVDVPLTYKHYEAINVVSDAGLIRGYPNRFFKPDQSINRAEALKILVEARFSKLMIDRALSERRTKNHWYVAWPDVLITDWFAPYVEIAAKNNMVRGYGDNTFKPAGVLNFAEGLKMILGAHGVSVAQTPFRTSKLLYVQPGDWFAPYFGYAQTKNLLNPNKFYHPAQLMTRGEFAEILYRLRIVQANALESFVDSPITSNEYTVTLPRLNMINQKVAFANPYDEDGALEVLRRFPLGHYLAEPGKGQKFVLYGHSSGYAWDQSPYKVVLRQIDKLKNGDEIFINYREVGYVYRVYGTDLVPESQDTKIMADKQKNEIAIYTCWPPDSTKYRYVVYGRPL